MEAGRDGGVRTPSKEEARGVTKLIHSLASLKNRWFELRERDKVNVLWEQKREGHCRDTKEVDLTKI